MKRIQRSRQKGWRKPPGSVYVGRPTKWGNPMKVIKDIIYIDASRRMPPGKSKWVALEVVPQGAGIKTMLWYYENLLKGKYFGRNVDLYYWANRLKQLPFEKLKDKDLLCWCSLEEDCHADVLLTHVRDLYQ